MWHKGQGNLEEYLNSKRHKITETLYFAHTQVDLFFKKVNRKIINNVKQKSKHWKE